MLEAKWKNVNRFINSFYSRNLAGQQRKAILTKLNLLLFIGKLAKRQGRKAMGLTARQKGPMTARLLTRNRSCNVAVFVWL